MLRNWKERVHPFDRRDAVYCVTVWDCKQKHFGETERSLRKRKKGHTSNIKHCHPDKRALAKHPFTAWPPALQS